MGQQGLGGAPLTQVAENPLGGLVPLNKRATYHRSVDYLVYNGSRGEGA